MAGVIPFRICSGARNIMLLVPRKRAVEGVGITSPSWNSRKLAIFSIGASSIFCLICLTHFTEVTNGIVIWIVGVLVLREAGKKRQEENEASYKCRTTDSSPYDYMQSNNDLHIALAAMLVSLGLLFITVNLWVVSLVLVLAIFFAFSPALGNSMLPALGYGDILFVEKFLLFRRRINRGDVIGFPKPPGLKIDFPPALTKKRGLLGPMLLKRVIALPNESVSVTGGRVFINNVPLLEEAYRVDPAAYEINFLGDLGNRHFKPYSKSEDVDKPIVVPKDHYFVLGDFRIAENIDSHVFGFVPTKQIQYRLLAALPIAIFGLTIERQNVFRVTKYWQSAKKLILQGKLEDAIAECNNAIAIYSKCAPAFTYRAQAKFKLNQDSDAVNDCNLAIKYYKTTKDPAPGLWENAVIPYSLRSAAYMRLKKWKEALRDCNKVIALTKGNSTAYSNRAVLYREMGKPNEALKDCNRAISLNANDSKAYIVKALVLRAQSQFEGVIDNCNKAENVDKNDINIYYLRAGANIGLNRFDKAYAECMQAKELKLFNDQFTNVLGTACVFLKKWDEALENLNKAIDSGANAAVNFNNRALVHFELGHYDDSLSDCEAAINIDPNLAAAYKNRARIKMKQGNDQDALSDLNKAIELEPSRGDFYNYRSQAYTALGNTTLADSDLAKSREFRNENDQPVH